MSSATIIIPTFNRPLGLRRLLEFLALVQCSFPVLVLDASDLSIIAENKKTVERFKFAELVAYPANFHLGLRCADGLSRIQTKYVVICGDDDFVMPSGISACCEFLDLHDDFVAVTGRVFSLHYRLKKSLFRSTFVLKNELPNALNLSHRFFIQRLAALCALTEAGCPPFYYSLFRTDALREAYGYCTAQMKFSSLELLVNAVTLAGGYCKSLPIVFGIRDYSSGASMEPMRQDSVSYFAGDDLREIAKILAQKLIDTENTPKEIADHISELATAHFGPVRPSMRVIPLNYVQRALQKIDNGIARITSVLMPSILSKSLGMRHDEFAALLKVQRQYIGRKFGQ